MAPFLAQADATIANVATPAIRTGLGASGAAVELVIGGYLIAYAVLLITGARLGQSHGYKRLFMIGVAIFGISSLMGGLAPNVTVLVWMRVIQGAGAALMYPQTLTGIQLNFSGPERTRAIGLFAIALATGAVIGQILGGVLISADIAGSGWRPIFLINVPVCAAVWVAARSLLPADGRRPAGRLDLAGMGSLSTGVLLVVVPLIIGHQQGWPIWTWVCLGASVPAFGLFVRTERSVAAAGRQPLVDTGVLARPAVAFGLVAMLAATGTYYALLFTLAQYIQHGLGDGAITSGLILVPWVAAFGVAGQITRRLPASAGRILPFAGYLILAGAYLALSLAVSAGQGVGVVLMVLLGAGGLGLGTGFATMIGHLTSAAPARYAADISGVTSTALLIGGAIGVAAFGTLYLTLASHPGRVGASRALAGTSLALAITAVLASGAAYVATHARNEGSGVTGFTP